MRYECSTGGRGEWIERRQFASVKLELSTRQRCDVRVGCLTALPGREQHGREFWRTAFGSGCGDEVRLEPRVRSAIIV